MFKEKTEILFHTLGREMVESQMPLGFVNSKGFNPNFAPKDNPKLVKVLTNLATKTVAELEIENKVWNNLPTRSKQSVLAYYLLTKTICYVATSERILEDDSKYATTAVDVSVGTLNKDLVNLFDKNLAGRTETSVNKVIANSAGYLAEKELSFVALDYDKDKVRVPRKRPNINLNDFMVVPVSLVNGYVEGLRDLMKSKILTVTARKTKGENREFTLSSNEGFVKQIYNSPSVLNMFADLRLPLNYIYLTPTVRAIPGLSRLNMLFYEMGISDDDYPKRNLQLSRLAKITWVSEGEELEKKIRQVQRYANFDMEDVIVQVRNTCAKWSPEEMTEFMRDTIKRVTGKDSKIEITGNLDFQTSLSKTIQFYATLYIRSLIDYILEHPAQFGGYNGRAMSVDSISNAVTSSVSDVLVDIEDDDLEF